METDKAAIEVNAALNAVRRRARYLALAEGSWSWPEVVSGAALISWGLYMVARGAFDTPGLGAAFFLTAAAGGWHYQRLKTRVDALTKLLAEFEASGDHRD